MTYDLLVSGLLGGMVLVFVVAALVMGVIGVVNIVRALYGEPTELDERLAAVDDDLNRWDWPR